MSPTFGKSSVEMLNSTEFEKSIANRMEILDPNAQFLHLQKESEATITKLQSKVVELKEANTQKRKQISALRQNSLLKDQKISHLNTMLAVTAVTAGVTGIVLCSIYSRKK